MLTRKPRIKPSPNEHMWYEWGDKEILQELEKCARSPYYFIVNYVKIFSNDDMAPIPFTLWDTDVDPYDNQVGVITKYNKGNKIVALKARQLGLTWLFLALFLQSMLFRPNSFVLLISRGEAESIELLRRMKQMYKYLPSWMKVRETVVDSKTEWKLSNESNARALSTRKGDSYTASHVLIDEADLIHESGIDLRQVLLKVEPTIGQQGKLVLLSKSDKRNPDSTFKNVYRGAMKGESSYIPIFCPYNVHPLRTPEWREQQIKDEMAKDGTTDSVWENYPSTPEESLAPNQSGKRFRAKWLQKCKGDKKTLINTTGDFDHDNYPWYLGPTFSKLRIYEEPDPDEAYVIGVDPSAGAETSDPSPIVVMKISTQEDVAVFSGQAEPAVLGGYAVKLADYYNKAPILSAFVPPSARESRAVRSIDERRRAPLPEPVILDQEGASAQNRVELLFYLYLAGLAVGLTRLGVGLWKVHRLMKSGESVDLPVKPRTAVLQSSSVRIPLTVGALRPVILLPNDWRSWPPEMLQSVLEHEQTHVDRRDYVVGVLAELNRCFYWFHPWLGGYARSLPL